MLLAVVQLLTRDHLTVFCILTMNVRQVLAAPKRQQDLTLYASE